MRELRSRDTSRVPSLTLRTPQSGGLSIGWLALCATDLFSESFIEAGDRNLRVCPGSPHLRRREPQNVPIAKLTAHDQHSCGEALLNAGASALCLKPGHHLAPSHSTSRFQTPEPPQPTPAQHDQDHPIDPVQDPRRNAHQRSYRKVLNPDSRCRQSTSLTHRVPVGEMSYMTIPHLHWREAHLQRRKTTHAGPGISSHPDAWLGLNVDASAMSLFESVARNLRWIWSFRMQMLQWANNVHRMANPTLPLR
jgi:hypothetical protein